MHSPDELRSLINSEIAGLPKNAQPAELYDPIYYFMSLGGKRMRPVLLLSACELFGGKIQDAMKPALGIELFHNFSLLHDDIMDKSPLRRTQPTVNKKWNDNIAILSGDAMFVQACQLMMQCRQEIVQQVMNVFLTNALKVCEGQQYDMNFESEISVSVSQYLKMIELKTAVLLGASLEIGALISGAKNDDAKLLYDFGKNVGIAFQLQDDILDVYGDEKIFGKQKGRDIVSNKKTFLLIKALELSDKNSSKKLQVLLSEKNVNEEEKVKSVTEIYDSLGVRALARQEMLRHFEKGMKSLNAVNADTKRKEYLSAFAESLMSREN